MTDIPAGIDFVETGEGAPVVFIAGSFGTPAGWRPMQKLLPPRYRMAATSLCGYGKTAETRTLDDCGMEHEVRVIEAVVRHLPGPVHLVGHSFGGTIALATALAGRIQVASIATFEANPLAMTRAASPDLFAAMQAMSTAFEEAHFGGECDAAGRIIDFWGGAGSFAAMPEPVQDYCRRTAIANVLDWRCAYQFEAGPADYARLDVPVLLVRGGLANPAMVVCTEALADALPRARTAVVDGASHFLISTHPAECAALLGDFLADVNGSA